MEPDRAWGNGVSLGRWPGLNPVEIVARILRIGAAFAVVLGLLAACGSPAIDDVLRADDAGAALGLDDWLAVFQIELSEDAGHVAVAGLSGIDGAGIGVTSGGPLKFFAGPQGSLPAAVWLADGESLLVAEDLTRDSLNGDGGSVLSVITTDGAVLRQVPLDPPIAITTTLAASPDGLRAYAGARFSANAATADLVRIDLATGRVTRLTHTPALNEGSPVALADGSVIHTAGPPDFDPDNPSRVYLIDPSGSTRTLTDKTFHAPEVTASDDGKVYFMGRDVESQRIDLALWSTDISGSEPVFVRSGFRSPTISRDGSLLIALTIDGNGLVVIEP